MKAGGWLASMAARVFVLLLVGVTLAATLAFAVSDIQRREAAARTREQRLAERVVDLAYVLNRAPAALRPELLGDGPEAARPAPTNLAAAEVDAALTRRLVSRLAPVAAPEARVLPADDCRPPPPGPRPHPPAELADEARPPAPVPPPPPTGQVATRPPSPDCRLVALTLADGQRVRLILPAGPRPPRDRLTPFGPTMLAVLAAAAAALAYLTARFATAPLHRLSRAADDLGRDLERPPLTLEGPLEVRRAAAAFNAMQADLKRRQAERTYMLAAITHDLQTPLTRLRLRIEKVADPALREQLLGDQAAMVDLVREGLDLARMAEAGAGTSEELDIDSLLESLCADAVEADADVRVTGGCGCAVRTHPAALARCMANLLDNALKYAGAAELSAEIRGPDVILQVLDRGPGIPSEDMAAVFEPFRRLETSRSRETGGAGLGLTLAKLLAERAGGRLSLSSRPGGGLRAAVTLQASGGPGAV